MKLYNSCEPAIHDCLLSETFSIAHLSKCEKTKGYASDILEQAAIAEPLVMIYSLIKGTEAEPNIAGCYVEKEVMQILRYINQNISSQLTVEDLASHFYISTSYMCRIFKKPA